MNLPEINILALLPALIVALTGVVVMVVDPFIDRSSRGKLGWLGFAGILGALLALRPMSANRGFWYADLWWVDDYAIFFHATFLLIAAITIPCFSNLVTCIGFPLHKTKRDCPGA